MTSNYEYSQMLGKHAIWIKSSVFTNFKIEIPAHKLLEDLKNTTRGRKITTKIYSDGLDRFICRGFKYEFLGFI